LAGAFPQRLSGGYVTESPQYDAEPEDDDRIVGTQLLRRFEVLFCGLRVRWHHLVQRPTERRPVVCFVRPQLSEYRDENGDLVVTAIGVGIITGKVVEG